MKNLPTFKEALDEDKTGKVITIQVPKFLANKQYINIDSMTTWNRKYAPNGTKTFGKSIVYLSMVSFSYDTMAKKLEVLNKHGMIGFYFFKDEKAQMIFDNRVLFKT